jgi:hypothetical protein
VGAHALPSVATAVATGSAAAKTVVQDLVAAAYESDPSPAEPPTKTTS